MIYHYTKEFNLASILEKGLIPWTIILWPGEKPVLYFTTNPRWENTVLIGQAETLRDSYDLAIKGRTRLVRISCDDSVVPHRWKQIKDLAAIPYSVAHGLYTSAIQVGSRPGEWRATLDVVPPEKFLAIEFFDGDSWKSDIAQMERAA
jgi:hypothetical protein